MVSKQDHLETSHHPADEQSHLCGAVEQMRLTRVACQYSNDAIAAVSQKRPQDGLGDSGDAGSTSPFPQRFRAFEGAEYQWHPESYNNGLGAED